MQILRYNYQSVYRNKFFGALNVQLLLFSTKEIDLAFIPVKCHVDSSAHISTQEHVDSLQTFTCGFTVLLVNKIFQIFKMVYSLSYSYTISMAVFMPQ